MGVQLNIKDAETVRLARELADASGRSVTETIRAALWKERESHKLEVERRKTSLREIVAYVQTNMPDGWRGKTSKEIMDELYDDDGLPI